ncbi:MAG: 3-phosphoshikimate 1-carboxyvinyltransferase, partial [Candidatus Zixiibacteriota bacterium]
MDKIVKRSRRLKGEVVLPGDRSISHQAAILAAISEGESLIRNFSDSLECRKTLDCLQLLGVPCELEGRDLKIAGVGRDGLTAPSQPLDAGNSDTTMYLLAAILAPQSFSCEIEGGSYLQRRSPEEVIDPLIQMGANIVHPEGAGAPLNITGGPLIGIHYSLPFPSALTKSAILLAGLYAEGETTVMEKIPTRDQTERLLQCFGVERGPVSLD